MKKKRKKGIDAYIVCLIIFDVLIILGFIFWYLLFCMPLKKL